MNTNLFPGCGRPEHWNRRSWLKAAGVGAASWLTPVSRVLARQHEQAPSGATAKSVIVLWMQGGPSQLETFDPHPGTNIAGGSKAISTANPAVKLGEGLPRTAELMQDISLIRAMTSKEGDHERAIYNIKTGYRPDPTVVHPAVGAVICHQTQDQDGDRVEIPRHVSILPGPFASTGGYLGDQFDAFKTWDPVNQVPDLAKQVSEQRYRSRLNDLQNVVDREFARGRIQKPGVGVSVSRHLTEAALKMMDSDQLAAFDVSKTPQTLRDEFGDTPFGRGCLAAIQLIETGVRCVEVTLQGWDSHINNHETHRELLTTLDPAFSALIRELKSRDRLKDTLVLCGGEFGRTPTINGAGGRDHWPHGFSMAIAGGGVAGGRVVGETSPEPNLEKGKTDSNLVDSCTVEDLHATIYQTLGIDWTHEYDTPIGRPMKISQGRVIESLLG